MSQLMSFSFFGRAWAWIKIPVFVLLVLFVGFFMWSLNLGRDKVLTDRAVAKIHATRLTRNDVYGSLPPAPDPAQNDATLAGIDSNQNGIRDDVEIAIYKAHSDSATTTAAMLQYAKELQLEFTDVFNSATLVAVIQEESRGNICILNLKLSSSVESMVFNNQMRKDARELTYNKYMTGYALPNSSYCDLDPATLHNSNG